jgi:uncharacterized protein
MAVVSDSSPLIALGRIGQLSLIRRLAGPIVVPPAVAHEVYGADAPPDWIHVQSLGSSVAVGASLGRGEQEAIVLALELGARWILLDDLPARRSAARLGLRVVGTVGVLLAAKRSGLVDEIRPLLDALDAAEFREEVAFQRPQDLFHARTLFPGKCSRKAFTRKYRASTDAERNTSERAMARCTIHRSLTHASTPLSGTPSLRFWSFVTDRMERIG